MAVCPSCGTENPESAKFCNECASPLTEAPLVPAALREVLA